MKKFILTFILSTAFAHASLANISCEQKLIDKDWPVDCLLLLHFKKLSKKSLPYKNLNHWCHLNAEELWKKSPPPAVFTLYMPKECLKNAQIALKHHRAKQVLTGSFLNSFP